MEIISYKTAENNKKEDEEEEDYKQDEAIEGYGEIASDDNEEEEEVEEDSPVKLFGYNSINYSTYHKPRVHQFLKTGMVMLEKMNL